MGLGVAAGLSLWVMYLSSAAWAKAPEPVRYLVPPIEDGAEGETALELRPEYRTRLIRIEPLDVNGDRARTVEWAEQRLRLDATLGKRGVGAIHVQVDLLDGALFGDNGQFGREPLVSSGMGLASKQANLAGWRVGLLEGGDPLDMDDYGAVLRPIDPVNVNFAYGEVNLPIGIFRVGRQPVVEEGLVGVNDGRSWRNRWGASFYHQSADRILFGTKISEVFSWLSEGAAYTPDPRPDRGVIMAIVYDHLVEDSVVVATDDLRSVGTQLSLRLPESDLLGDGWEKLELTATMTYRWDERFNTSLLAVPMRARATFYDVSLRADAILVNGTTRELSAGFAKLTSADVVDQKIDAWAARAQLDWKVGDFTLTGEWGYASGDTDPRPSTPMTAFQWARDTNLGLVLFEHVLAFQSARSAAVGIENLAQLDADSFPLTEVATDGRVTNVNALFPQIFYDATDNLRFKAGVLFAWAAEPVTDPIQSLLALDGNEIADDAVNYHGGKPGRYWGTEIDVGLIWTCRSFFHLELEAGWLNPGDGLEDEHGDAVPAWLVESRFTFVL